MEYNEIYNELIKRIPLNKSDNPYAILFIAGPGFGKSTVAKLLSKKLDLYIASNDSIRRVIDNEKDVPETRDLVIKVAFNRLEYILQNKISHILDGDSEFSFDKLYELYNKYGFKVIVIKLECSEETILKRLDNRALSFGKNDNESRATDKHYYEYLERLKNKNIKSEFNYFVINTDTSYEEVEKQVDELISKIML